MEVLILYEKCHYEEIYKNIDSCNCDTSVILSGLL